MKIGLAGPITVNALKDYLDNPQPEHLKLGMLGTAVQTLANGLLAAGHQLSIYTLSSGLPQPLILKGKQLTIYVGRLRPNRRLRMLDLFNQEAKQIKAFILQDKPDIVNAHWSYEFAEGTLRAKVPHLITFRDSTWEMFKFNPDPARVSRLLQDFWVRRRGKNFSVNSSYLQDKLSFFRKNIPIIPNPINQKFILDKGRTLSSDKITLVSVLNFFSKRKNAYPALLAFQELRKKYGEKIEYHFYGADFEAGGLAQQWAEAHASTEGVVFNGKIDHNQLMSKMPHFDILIHPALEESFGNTLLEGLASGVPVVAGEKAGAIPWVLNYGKNGILVDVSSPAAIAQAIEKLIDNPVRYAQLSEEGIDYVRQNFSIEVVTQMYVDMYKKILAK
ncbi:MAG: glycosyltransferase family 4 protein [Microscillaceae bacterium]|jgi:glycosyltransferase involved in cell wall biosynthesis|nr:glycosyltransferase family 4 protein [Microscillaceae bacterium]